MDSSRSFAESAVALHTGAQVETEKRSLCDGACRKPVPLAEPRRRACV